MGTDGRGRAGLPSAADVTLALVLAGAVVAEALLWQLGDDRREFRFPAVPVPVVAGVLLGSVLLRRAAPSWAPLGPAVAVTGLATGPIGTAPFMFAPAIGLAVLSYLAGSATRHPSTPGSAAVLAAGAVVWSLLVDSPDRALFVPVELTLFGGLPWLVGRYRNQQRALMRASAERITRLEHEQHMVAERARLRERAELAEEMHDSLGHELTLLALRAGALELAPELPEQQRAAVGELRAAAGAATGRLAEIVTVLRAGPPPRQPPDGSVTRLVDRARESGLPVTLTGAGTPPAGVQRTVHRVVQEALTNAAKHAPGSPVTVDVRSDDSATTVTVTNPLPDPVDDAPATPAGAGYGLTGVRERVRLLGGELSVEPGRGVFRLSARLPHRGPPPGPVPGEER